MINRYKPLKYQAKPLCFFFSVIPHPKLNFSQNIHTYIKHFLFFFFRKRYLDFNQYVKISQSKNEECGQKVDQLGQDVEMMLGVIPKLEDSMVKADSALDDKLQTLSVEFDTRILC